MFDSLDNSVQLIGNLGKDPQVRYSGEMAITNFRIAVNKGFGEKRKTTWVPIRALGKLGEIVGNNLSQGRKILVKGSLAEGITRGGNKYLYVLASQIRFLDNPKAS